MEGSTATRRVPDLLLPSLARRVEEGKYIRFVTALTEQDLFECLAAAFRFYQAFVGEPSISEACFTEACVGLEPPSPDEQCFPPITFSNMQGSQRRIQEGLIGVYCVIRNCHGVSAPLEGDSLVRVMSVIHSIGGTTSSPFVAEFRRRLESRSTTQWASCLDEPGAYDLLWSFGEIEARTHPIGAARSPQGASVFPGGSTTSTRADAPQIVAAADALVRALHAHRFRDRIVSTELT